MAQKTEMVTCLVEKELWDAIEQEKGREPRSSFVRRILVRWYNSLGRKPMLKE